MLDRKQMAVDGRRERIKANARALLADVAASDIAIWPEWHRIVFSGVLSVPLIFRDKVGLDDQLAEGLASARDEIAGELGEDVEVGVLRNMILG
jgi:hypothetical protein